MNGRIQVTFLGVLVSGVLVSPSAHAQRSDIRFTDSAQALLAQARSEARRLGHEYVGTEHLVLALPSQPQGNAAVALRKQQVDLERLREAIGSIVRPGRAARLAQ